MEGRISRPIVIAGLPDVGKTSVASVVAGRMSGQAGPASRRRPWSAGWWSGRTTESSARRAYQRLSTVYDAKADPTSTYPGEVPTLLKKAAELASDHGAPLSVLAEALKISIAQVRDLLGEADQRPVLRLVGND